MFDFGTFDAATFDVSPTNVVVAEVLLTGDGEKKKKHHYAGREYDELVAQVQAGMLGIALDEELAKTTVDAIFDRVVLEKKVRLDLIEMDDEEVLLLI